MRQGRPKNNLREELYPAESHVLPRRERGLAERCAPQQRNSGPHSTRRRGRSKATLENSPIPKYKIISGMKAMGGIGRRKEKIGPRIALSQCGLDPSTDPPGTPMAIPNPKHREGAGTGWPKMCSVSDFPAYPLPRGRQIQPKGLPEKEHEGGNQPYAVVIYQSQENGRNRPPTDKE